MRKSAISLLQIYVNLSVSPSTHQFRNDVATFDLLGKTLLVVSACKLLIEVFENFIGNTDTWVCHNSSLLNQPNKCPSKCGIALIAKGSIAKIAK